MTNYSHSELPPDDALWDVKRIARHLGVSVSWIYKLAEREELPYVRLGTLLRFEPAAIRAWLDAKKKGVTSLTVEANESVTSKSAPSK